MIGKSATLFLLLLFFISCKTVAQEAGYTWPLSDGWGKEVIPFPLKFAKELNYHGVEEIHFTPEWRDSGGKKNYWTYLFSWYLDTVVQFSTTMLVRDLEEYYNGLNEWVLKNSRRVPVAVPSVIVSLEQVERNPEMWRGQVKTTDVFAALSPITLNLEIRKEKVQPGRSLFFFLVSQRNFQDGCWMVLLEEKNTFREEPPSR